MPKGENNIDGDIDEGILGLAVDYLMRFDEGNLSADEILEWQNWIALDPQHAIAAKRAETLWYALSEEVSTKVNVIVADQKPTASVSFLDQVENTGTSNKKPNGTSRQLPWGSVAAAACLAFVVGISLIFGDTRQDLVAQPTEFTSAQSEQRVVRLTDGSIAELGPDSEISVQYTAETRRVLLKSGEAIFTVAKNPDKPFVVEAGEGSVTAVGTVFNVKKTSDDVSVTVLEGTVAVRGERLAANENSTWHDVTLVTAGRKLRYDATGVQSPTVSLNLDEEFAWRTGVLTMVGMPLSDVIREINRYITTDISIGDPVVGQLPFTGTVYPDRLDEWLTGLEKGYAVQAVKLENGATVLVRRRTRTE